MKVKVYAKLNLALDVVGVKNKMHALSMCNASINIFDVVTVEKSNEMICNFSEVSFDDNVAVKAALAMKKEFGLGNVKITIEKGIPYGAGLGGSSADGAAVIYCMRKLFDVKDDKRINKVAISLGSDIPYMLVGGYCFVEGIGEVVEKINTDISIEGIVVKGRKSTCTGEVYDMFDRLSIKGNDSALSLKRALERNDYKMALSLFSNDLENPSKIVNEEITLIEDIIGKYNPTINMVAGSGSGVFAVFDSLSQDIIDEISAKVFYLRRFKCVNKGVEEMQ